MQIGIPWWIGAGAPLEGIQRAHELGADFVEISLDAPWPDTLDASELRSASEDTGVDIGFHGPWRTQALAHPRPELAQAARTVAQTCIDTAIRAGASYIVFHVDARDFGRFPDRRAIQQGLEQAHASLRALSQGAGDTLDVLVENTSSPLGTPSELATFLDAVPEIGFCYDPGHAALAEEAQVEGATSDPSDWADALADRYRLLHLMDWIQTEHGIVDHLVPGAGETDLASLIRSARNAGCESILVEAFFRDTQRTDATPDDMAQACQTVRELL